ncbi:Solute carrier 7 member 3 [Sparganum proliferum]
MRRCAAAGWAREREPVRHNGTKKTDTSEILEASAPFVFRGTQFLASALTKKMATSGQLGRSAEESQVKSASSCLHFRPNYFVCQRITNSELLTGLTRIIEHVCSEQTIYAPFAYSSAQLHLTWCTFYAADKHEAERALACLHTARTDLCQLAPRDSLRVQGVGQFSGHLLYASVIPDPTLATFAEKIQAILQSENIATPGNKHPFTPHLTLIKRNPKAKRILKSNLIDSDLLTNFQETLQTDGITWTSQVVQCVCQEEEKEDEEEEEEEEEELTSGLLDYVLTAALGDGGGEREVDVVDVYCHNKRIHAQIKRSGTRLACGGTPRSGSGRACALSHLPRPQKNHSSLYLVNSQTSNKIPATLLIAVQNICENVPTRTNSPKVTAHIGTATVGSTAILCVLECK